MFTDNNGKIIYILKNNFETHYIQYLLARMFTDKIWKDNSQVYTTLKCIGMQYSIFSSPEHEVLSELL